MTRNKIVLFLSFSTLLIVVGIYARRKFYDPKLGLEAVSKFVNILSDKNDLKDGDIIFQTSLSSQSKAIQLATHSQFSHCGIIYKEGGRFFVFEAIQPVKQTPLDKWISRGEGGHFVVKRLKDADKILTTETLNKMKQIGSDFNGKNYDIYFDWSDEKIYCSELIWKIYQRATGIEIGKLEKLRDFDLADEGVKQVLKSRYGNNIPLDETVISPIGIFNSDLLESVTLH